MMAERKRIESVLRKEFGIEAAVTSFGDNERNNVFLARSGKAEYIAKLEDADRIEQIRLSFEAAALLSASELLSSSRFLKAKSGECFVYFEDSVVTVQHREVLTPLTPEAEQDYLKLGEAVGEFHRIMMNAQFEQLRESDFYYDYMYNEIPLAQPKERLEEIHDFYRRFRPDETLLSTGVVHNDLNLGNIQKAGKKIIILDFEYLKRGPLVSDLGVLALELWEYEKGMPDYIDKLSLLLNGYEKQQKLAGYDKKTIPVYSLRYLYSDENLYHYWSVNGNRGAANFLPEIREKQNLLLRYLVE